MTQLTRKAANARVRELEARLAAQSGETRKNMRERLARTTKEVAELKNTVDTLKSTVQHSDGLLRDVAIELAKMGGPAKTLCDTKLSAYVKVVPPSAPPSDVPASPTSST